MWVASDNYHLACTQYKADETHPGHIFRTQESLDISGLNHTGQHFMLIKSKYSSCICKMVMNTQWSLQTWEDVIVQHTLHADSLWYEVNGLHHYGYSDIIDMHTCTTSNDTHPLSLIHTQTCQPMSYICPNTNILSSIHTHTHSLSLWFWKAL